MKKSDIVPILYFGENRNGTTWLGNTLVKQFGVAASFHEFHFGVLEPNLYSLNKVWKNLKSDEDYKIFLRKFFQSDLFISLEGDEAYFLDNRHVSYFEFYLDLIHHYAQKKELKAWAIKLEPKIFYYNGDLESFINQVEARYTSIKYICIQRNFDDYYKSSRSLLTMSNNRNKIHDFKLISAAILTSKYKFYYGKFKKYIKKKDGYVLEYDDFKANNKSKLIELSAYLNLHSTQRIFKEVTKNSSSKNTINQNNFFEKVVSNCFLKLPFLSTLTIHFLEFIQKNKESSNIHYRIYDAKNNQEKLINELSGSFENILINKIRNTK